jgi:hypothetical protein
MISLAWRRAAGEIRVDCAFLQNITPLTETVVPFLPGKIIVPVAVIKSLQPSVATFRGMGVLRTWKSKSSDLSPVKLLDAPVSNMILVLVLIASAVALPAIWSLEISSLMVPTSTLQAVTGGVLLA